jgi:hypothetical protein
VDTERPSGEDPLYTLNPMLRLATPAGVDLVETEEIESF